jgi:mannose-6-phosphate isomerase-like protein (cupin superfamily)
MIAVIPQGAWHRDHSEGNTHLGLTPFPGEHVERDVDDPRRERKPGGETQNRAPDIVDLNAEVAKLTMFQGRTPRSTMADRQGSAARLASYRDGALAATKFAGKGHWERHIADELIHILDGMATLDVAGEDRPQSLALRAGMMTVIPRATWHRFRSADGVMLMTATSFPSETIEDDLDDPRRVQNKAI